MERRKMKYLQLKRKKEKEILRCKNQYKWNALKGFVIEYGEITEWSITDSEIHKLYTEKVGNNPRSEERSTKILMQDRNIPE